MKKILFSFFAFCFLALFQASFFGGALNSLFYFNFVLLLLFFLLVFEKEERTGSLSFFQKVRLGKDLGVFYGFLAGLFLDIFSFFPFGFFTLNLTVSSFLLKKVLKNFEKSNILTLPLVYSILFFCYKAILFLEKTVFEFLKEGASSFHFIFNPSSLLFEFIGGIFLVLLAALAFSRIKILFRNAAIL